MVKTMFKVKNKKIINEITRALLKYNKNRNIVAGIAIILTTLMFTSIFTVGFGLKKSMEYERMRMVGGDFHIGFKQIEDEELENIKSHRAIKEYGIRNMIGYGKNEELYGENVEISIGDENYLKHSFIKLDEGTMPMDEKDIIIDRRILEMLGKEAILGEKIELDFEVSDNMGFVVEEKVDEFTVVGIFTGDELSMAKFIYLSDKYADLIDIPNGNKSLNVMVNNSFNLRGKAEKIISDSGYTTDRSQTDHIAYGINWGYSTEDLNGMDLGSVIGMFVLLLVVVLTGYLIIYNVFNISSYLDIKMYGLMKAIGVSEKQLKNIILKQAFIISIFSIPIGSALGYLVGNNLLPLIVEQSIMGENYRISKNPWIFLLTVLMTLLTVYISAIKPGKKVGKVSPLEAILNEDMDRSAKYLGNYKLSVKSLGRINVFRNKSKLLLVVLSISLSMIVLNSTIIFLGEPDLNKYLVEFINSDFVLAEKGYYNYRYIEPVKEDLVDGVKGQKSFKAGGGIYLNYIEARDKLNDQNVTIYGLDDFVLARQKILLGQDNLDLLNLKKDEVLLGVKERDLELIKTGEYKHKLGDILKLKVGNLEREYKILGFIEYGMTNTSRSYSVTPKLDDKGNETALIMDDLIFMNMATYGDIVDEPNMMVYQFDVSDDASMRIYLDDLVEKNTIYKYDSRDLQKDSLKGVLNLLLLIGGLLSFVIGFIGILNFINVLITNIISRKNEFKLMNSIGMTNRELVKMIEVESMYYFIYTGILGTVLAILSGEFLLKPIMKDLYFTSYRFSLKGIFLVLLIFLPICKFLPNLAYGKIKNNHN